MLSVVIVAYRSGEDLGRTLPALERQLGPGDEIIVVDNDGTHGELASRCRVLAGGGNVGFAAGCNRGASVARGELLVFLNPDAVPMPGWRDAMAAPLAGPWTAWQALVVAGDAVNASSLQVHFTGLAWASTQARSAGEVAGLSGACLAVRADAFRACGGFAEHYFLYHEDVDLSMRLRLRGGRLGLAADACVEHGYEFEKGAYKWRRLERNRWATVIRCWPLRVLLAVLPALVAAEAAIWVAALRGGWAREKGAATADVLRSAPAWLGERRAIQGARRIPDGEFARWLTADLTSPYLGAAEHATPLLRAYWRLASRLIGRPR